MYTYPIRPNEIYHYGVAERSGRYPWGSGDRPYQRLGQKAKSFIKGDNYEKKEVGRLRTGIELGARGLATTAIASVAGLSVAVGTQNYMLGMATYNTVALGLLASPLGKTNIYFKKK